MRRVAVVVAAVAIAIAIGVAAPARAGDAERHRYVAYDFGSDVLASISESSGVAADGTVAFKPTSDRVVLRVDDTVVTRTVRLFVNTTDGGSSRCVRPGRPTVISGLVPGEWVAFTLLDATYRGSCQTGATTGVMTIRL